MDMKNIKDLENAFELWKTDREGCFEYLKSEGINYQVFTSYMEARQEDYKTLDFGWSNTIWEKDYEPILENLTRFGISTFTMSQTASGTIADCYWFVEHGYKIAGMTVLEYGHKWGDKKETKPAFVFKKGGRK